MPRRGDALHSLLLSPFTTHGRRLGARIHEEYRVLWEGRIGYIDRLVEYRHLRVALEGETSAHRVENAPWKAEAARATHLFVVLPNGRLARLAARKLDGLSFSGILFVTHFGNALHLFHELLNSCDASIIPGHSTTRMTASVPRRGDGSGRRGSR